LIASVAQEGLIRPRPPSQDKGVVPRF